MTEKEIQFVNLSVTLQHESEWKKIDAALDNIRIADIKTEFSLPIEFSEAIEEIPRKMLKSKNEMTVITVSPRKIRFYFKLRSLSESLKKIDEKKQDDPVAIFHEAESNFNLYLGVYLGAVVQPMERIDLDWRIRFKFNLDRHLVNTMVQASLFEKFKKFNTNANFDATKIKVNQQLEEEKASYEIAEMPEKKAAYLNIRRTFKLSLTTVDIVNLVQESIKNGNNLLTILGVGE